MTCNAHERVPPLASIVHSKHVAVYLAQKWARRTKLLVAARIATRDKQPGAAVTEIRLFAYIGTINLVRVFHLNCLKIQNNLALADYDE